MAKINEGGLLSLQETIGRDTGKILPCSLRAYYKNLIFKELSSGYVGLSGSLHKYYNDGLQNYDNFTFGKLKATMDDLKKRFGIDPSKAVLNNIEFGVNILVPFNPDDFIRSLVCYGSDPFIPERKPGIMYAQVRNKQYYVKIYNKSLQYAIPGNIVRFEVKVVRMAKIAKSGISTLQDLTIYERMSGIKDLLLDTFDKIIYCDDTINSNQFNQSDADLIRDGSNPRFWSNHYKKSGSNASKKFRRYQRLVNEHGKQGFNVIRNLISDQWDSLLTAQVQVRVFTELPISSEKPRVRVFTEYENCKNKSQDEKTELKYTSSYNLCIEKELIPSVSEGRKCKVSGHDISMQKPGSLFLNVKGLLTIYESDQELYNQLLSEIPPRWKNEDLKRQFEKIAHHVRDKFFNKRNYPRRVIAKLISEPALFDQRELISKEKWAIANQL